MQDRTQDPNWKESRINHQVKTDDGSRRKQWPWTPSELTSGLGVQHLGTSRSLKQELLHEGLSSSPEPAGSTETFAPVIWARNCTFPNAG